MPSGPTDWSNTATATTMAGSDDTNGDDMMADAMVTLDGKTGGRSPSGGSNIQLTIESLPMSMSVGSSIVVYLEDDFQEPDSIPMTSVYLVAENGSDNTAMQSRTTGRGARVYVTSPVKLKTSDYFDADKKDIAIRVLVPDMCTNATNECEGPNGLHSGQKVSVVIESDSGIKNPSESGSHSTGFALLGPSETEIPGRTSSKRMKLNDVVTVAKIGLSDVDNKRGYEMTVTGSGFNDGTTAGVHVLAHARYRMADWWETLNCDGMKAAMGSEDDKFCLQYDLMSSDMSYTIATDRGHDDFLDLDADMMKMYSDMVFDKHLCSIIVEGKTFNVTKDDGTGREPTATKVKGTNVGGALVGSDDKVTVTFEVTAPTFQPGNVNYICMVDGEGRTSDTDVEDFNLEPSIKVVPSSVSSGDTVNVFAQDYYNAGQGLSRVKIATTVISATGSSIRPDGSGTATFKVPGGLEGVLRIDAMWGDTNNNDKCDKGESACIEKNTKITITGGELNPSKTDVMPNESITVTGNGFGRQTCIPFANITLDNVELMVHPDSNSEDCTGKAVKVSNSGQFVATIILWPKTRGGTNPTLIPGTHQLEFEDDNGFSASSALTIAEPTIRVTPDIAGPRDYITITGENWPVDNLDNTLNNPVTICVEDYGEGDELQRSLVPGVCRRRGSVHRGAPHPSPCSHPRHRAGEGHLRRRGEDRVLRGAGIHGHGNSQRGTAGRFALPVRWQHAGVHQGRVR